MHFDMVFEQYINLSVLFCLLVSCSGTHSTKKSSTGVTNTNALLTYQSDITTGFLQKHLSALAADSMEGRETAMPGQKKAAKYLAGQYREMGLKAVGDHHSYYQKFNVHATVKDSIAFQTFALKGNRKNEIDHSVISKNTSVNYIPIFESTDSLQGRIVFAGFGINDSTHNINHFSGIDFHGKWVMVFQQIPHIVKNDTIINFSIDEHSRFQNILRSGAEGILIIPKMSQLKFLQTAKDNQFNLGKPKNMRLAYRDTLQSTPQGFSKGYNLINPDLAARLLGLKTDSIDLKSYKNRLLDNITTFRAKNLDFSLTQKPFSRKVRLETENVLAFLEGSDPRLKSEVIVMSSHYDHLGIGKPDSTGDHIYNGADDDGSGTVGLLNIARAFVDASKNGLHPRRSILFLNVTGEEKGLLGSRYYSDHPVFPIKKTITNINTDMIGRIDKEHKQKDIEDYTYIIGSNLISSELDSLITAANARSGKIELSQRFNDLNDPNQFYRRSDHWNFGRLGIPFVFFFTGVHEDYHQPSDEIQKIRFEKMVKIVRTIYTTAVLVANTDTAPQVDNQAFIEVTKKLE